MKRRHTLLAVKILVSAALLYLLYGRIDFGGMAARMRGLWRPPMALFFLLLFFNTAVSAVKWRILLKADDTHVPFGRLLVSYLIATFFNVFLPSNIGGDAYRIYDIARHSERPVNTFASVFADRLSGFIALSFFGLAFPLAGYGLLSDRRMLVPPLVVFALLGVTVWLLFQQRLIRAVIELGPMRRLQRPRDLAAKFLASIEAYRRRPRVMLRVMALSFVFQFAVIAAVYLLGRALRLEIPFFYFCIFIPLISLLEAIPVSIYGIGLRDSGYVFFLTQIGHTRAEAAALSLLYVAATLVYSSIGGVIFAVKRGSLS